MTSRSRIGCGLEASQVGETIHVHHDGKPIGCAIRREVGGVHMFAALVRSLDAIGIDPADAQAALNAWAGDGSVSYVGDDAWAQTQRTRDTVRKMTEETSMRGGR